MCFDAFLFDALYTVTIYIYIPLLYYIYIYMYMMDHRFFDTYSVFGVCMKLAAIGVAPMTLESSIFWGIMFVKQQDPPSPKFAILMGGIQTMKHMALL